MQITKNLIKMAEMCGYKYPCFEMLRKWIAYARTLQQEEEVSLYRAIAAYGLNEAEPSELNGDTLAYFSEVIRPNLDRQHVKMDKQLKRYRNGK